MFLVSVVPPDPLAAISLGVAVIIASVIIMFGWFAYRNRR